MIAVSKTQPRTLDEWLGQMEWKPVNRLQTAFALETPLGEAILSRSIRNSKSGWNTSALATPFQPSPNPPQLFAANREIQGPFKFAADSAGEIRLVSDIPQEAFSAGDLFDIRTGRSGSPLECWAIAATALAKGECPVIDFAKPATPDLVDWLKDQGYVASSDGDAAKITVALSGTFGEISIRSENGGMTGLSVELGSFKDWPAVSREAAVDFLGEANSRMRLVRIAEAEPMSVRLEAKLCAPGPGVWMRAGLDALRAGMALVVQPLASLRDPGVADMLLAGKKAKRKEGAK